MATTYSARDVAAEVLRQIEAEGITQAQWAKRAKISAAYLTDFLKGRRGPGPKILKCAGFEIEPQYRKARK
jgi:transcriptional regulator with XRE-family HTH domain